MGVRVTVMGFPIDRRKVTGSSIGTKKQEAGKVHIPVS